MSKLIIGNYDKIIYTVLNKIHSKSSLRMHLCGIDAMYICIVEYTYVCKHIPIMHYVLYIPIYFEIHCAH
jgi:hypothetical protein